MRGRKKKRAKEVSSSSSGLERCEKKFYDEDMSRWERKGMRVCLVVEM